VGKRDIKRVKPYLPPDLFFFQKEKDRRMKDNYGLIGYFSLNITDNRELYEK